MIGGFIGNYSLSHPFLLSALAALLAGGAVLSMKEAKTVAPEVRLFGAVLGLMRNRAFLLLCIAGFLAQLGYASFSIAIPLAGKGSGLSPSQIGTVLSSYSLSFALLQVPAGVYAERAGKRRLVASASFLSALLFLGLYMTKGFLPMVLLMALLGITLGAIFIQSTALAA